jgi:hypothetical protein
VVQVGPAKLLANKISQTIRLTGPQGASWNGLPCMFFCCRQPFSGQLEKSQDFLH